MKKTDTAPAHPAYRPFSCDTYSQIELAVMHKQSVHLTWHDAKTTFSQLVQLSDLDTLHGEEFVHGLLPSGDTVRVRLDDIDQLRAP